MLFVRPVVTLLQLVPQAALGRRRADAGVRQQDRQQHQIGENQHRHPHARSDGQVLDDLDVDHHQHRKAHRIGQQRGHAGEEQAAKRVARRHQPVGATPDVLHDAVHFLRAMAHADGEYQKRHQYRVRVQFIAQRRQQPQQPHHRHHRTQHHQQGAAQAAGVPEQHRSADRDGGGKKHQHLLQAVDQIPHDLGKARDVDSDFVRLILGAQLLDTLGQPVIIDAFAGFGDLLLQRHQDDARLVVGRHQLPDFPGALDVDAHLFEALGRAVEVIGNHRAAVQAVFGHAGPAHRRGPQRFHVRPVDAGNQEHLIAELAHGVQVVGIENRPLLGLHGNAQGVAHPRQLFTVFEEIGDVRMAGGDHLFVGGIQRKPQGLVTQHQGDQQADQRNRQTVVEQQPFGERARALVELVQIGNHCIGR